MFCAAQSGLSLVLGAHDAKIDPHAFCCPLYEGDEGCNRSIGGTLGNGKFATMSFIGRAYASAEFRLVMVGMDHGEAFGDDFTERREGIVGSTSVSGPCDGRAAGLFEC
jgi:hypothetical protein